MVTRRARADEPIARFITIKVVGRDAPELDISDFSVFEAHNILDECTAAVYGHIPSPIVMANGEPLELDVVETEETE